MKKFIVMLAVGLASIVGLSARENSPWREVQAVEIPNNVEIHEGTTKTGKAKFWIEVEGVKVNVAPTNASKFQKGEVKLELVKWQNTETKAYKYSTRQKKDGTSATKSSSKDINLNGVFK